MFLISVHVKRDMNIKQKNNNNNNNSMEPYVNFLVILLHGGSLTSKKIY